MPGLTEPTVQERLDHLNKVQMVVELGLRFATLAVEEAKVAGMLLATGHLEGACKAMGKSAAYTEASKATSAIAQEL